MCNREDARYSGCSQLAMYRRWRGNIADVAENKTHVSLPGIVEKADVV